MDRRYNSACPEIFVQTPGSGYRSVVAYSNYNDPIQGGGWRGYSRRWGDAPLATQQAAANEIVDQGRALGLSDSELAFALSVARVESGFNPDAAAGTTSASGIGQLIRSTATDLGVRNPFDLKEGVTGFLTLLSNVTKQSERMLPGASQELIFQRAYGLYHDGPSLKFGGEEIAQTKVIPWIKRMGMWLTCQ
jgi:putative chitinase